MGRVFVAGFGGIFFLVGAGLCLFLGVPTLSGAKASESWPTVDGVVIESRVESKRSSGKNNGTTYKAIVVYDYEVDGQPYSSGRIWFGSDISTSNQAQMRNTTKQYPKGQTVKVHYDPENPLEAVLQPGAFWSSYFMIVFGSVFAFIGGAVLLVAAFGMKSKSNPTDHGASNRADEFGRFPADDDGFKADFHSDHRDDFDD